MNPNPWRRSLLAAGLLQAAQSALQPAWAQRSAWPARPVRLVVPFPAGGSTDLVARYLAKGLGERLGQPFVVDNRTGASGNIGTDAVAKAAPDGHTLGLVTSGPLVNNRYLFKRMPFDAVRDLAPIALACEIPMVFATQPARTPATGLPQFLAAAQAGQGRSAVGTPGNGTIGHLTLEAINLYGKATLHSVPYRGDVPGITDLLGGSIDAVVGPITAFIPHLQSGRLRGLAVTSSQRFPGLPDIPTAQEQGIPVTATVWLALVGPAGLPDAIVGGLNAAANGLLESREGRERLAAQGAVVATGAPGRVRERIGADGRLWQQVIEATGIRIE